MQGTLVSSSTRRLRKKAIASENCFFAAAGFILALATRTPPYTHRRIRISEEITRDMEKQKRSAHLWRNPISAVPGEPFCRGVYTSRIPCIRFNEKGRFVRCRTVSHNPRPAPSSSLGILRCACKERKTRVENRRYSVYLLYWYKSKNTAVQRNQ